MIFDYPFINTKAYITVFDYNDKEIGTVVCRTLQKPFLVNRLNRIFQDGEKGFLYVEYNYDEISNGRKILKALSRQKLKRRNSNV